jgi:hypothetical protein
VISFQPRCLLLSTVVFISTCAWHKVAAMQLTRDVIICEIFFEMDIRFRTQLLSIVSQCSFAFRAIRLQKTSLICPSSKVVTSPSFRRKSGTEQTNTHVFSPISTPKRLANNVQAIPPPPHTHTHLVGNDFYLVLSDTCNVVHLLRFVSRNFA